MEQFLGDMNDTAASVVYIIIPSQKISVHAPAVIINLVSGFEKRKLFADLAFHLPVDFDFKCWKQSKQPLPDNSQFTIISVIYV